MHPKATQVPAAQDSDGGKEFDRYLYLVTHDLRACFRALRTIPSWIREDLHGVEVPEEVGSHLDMLEVQALRGDRMLLDLREFSRVGRLCGPVVTEPVRDIAQRCWESLGPPAGMTLDLGEAEGAATLPQDDATRLFAALLDNMAKHRDAPEGHGAIRSGPSPSGGLILRFDDDGPGIQPRFRERAFELLTTLRPRDAVEGSGVGLAVARRIVQTAGGEIALEDGPDGTGLSVVIHLPPGIPPA